MLRSKPASLGNTGLRGNPNSGLRGDVRKAVIISNIPEYMRVVLGRFRNASFEIFPGQAAEGHTIYLHSLKRVLLRI